MERPGKTNHPTVVDETLQNKPIRYVLPNGREQAEHLPWRLPGWFSNLFLQLIRYKDFKRRNFYYYELRLTKDDPIARKYNDLQFIDHIKRDHSPSNPPLWHEKVLNRWLRYVYGADIAWFDGIIVGELDAAQSERIYAYAARYFDVGFNTKMRLVYHGCDLLDYSKAVEKQNEMWDKLEKEYEAIYKRQVRRAKRTK